MPGISDSLRPIGPMTSILASTTAPSGTLFNFNGPWTALITGRNSTEDAYVFWGPTSAAIASSVIPVIGAPGTPNGNCVNIPSWTPLMIDFCGPTFLGAMTITGNEGVDILPCAPSNG